MKKSPLVSIIVPVYNVEIYAEACLESILNQTYKHIELIVVNDASPGNIKEIVRSLQKQHKNITLVDLETNHGLFQARIAGMKQATGDYVAHIDGDDTVCVDYIERLVARAMETDADIVLGETIVYQEKTRAKHIYNAAKSIDYDEVIKKEQGPFTELLRKDNYFWEICGKLYSKTVVDSALEELSRIDRHLVMGEDMLFNIHLTYYCRRLARAEFAFYNYLINDGSVTAKNADVDKKKKVLADLMFVFETAKDFMQKKGVYNVHQKQYRYLRNMQAAKYYMEICEDFTGRNKKELLKMVDEMAFDQVGFKYEVSMRQASDFDDINHLIWKLESMNSIKTSGMKFLSNVKRKLKSVVGL